MSQSNLRRCGPEGLRHVNRAVCVMMTLSHRMPIGFIDDVLGTMKDRAHQEVIIPADDDRHERHLSVAPLPWPKVPASAKKPHHPAPLNVDVQPLRTPCFVGHTETLKTIFSKPPVDSSLSSPFRALIQRKLSEVAQWTGIKASMTTQAHLTRSYAPDAPLLSSVFKPLHHPLTISLLFLVPEGLDNPNTLLTDIFETPLDLRGRQRVSCSQQSTHRIVPQRYRGHFRAIRHKHR